MQELDREKKAVEEQKKKLEQEKQWVAAKLRKDAEALALTSVKPEEVDDPEVKEKLTQLQKEEKAVQEKESEVKKKERLMPWNVDTLSKDGFAKTLINKDKPRVDTSKMTEEEKEEYYKKFVKENEKDIKHFGMLSKWDDCKAFLVEKPHLVCEETANYLAIWCVNLAMEEKMTLMEHVSKQVISMQYILELAKQLDRDPRACVPSFFTRIQTAEPEYLAAFNDELNSFRVRIKARAEEKMEKLMKEVEEEERQKRLGPGGLDPVEVFESLPKEMQECFESRDLPKLQTVISAMDEETARYHMKRCVDSGLWVPDASTLKEENGVTEQATDIDDSEASAKNTEEPIYTEPQKAP
jgi:cell division cycle protein 37